MVFAVESIGQLITNLSVFAGGMAIAILALVMAISRSTTKNSEHWSLLFAAFSWVIALIIPNMWYSGTIFATGTFALIIAYMPIMEKAGDTNIFIMAIMAAIINMLILMGSGAFTVSLLWQDNYDSSMDNIQNIVQGQVTNLGDSIPENRLCRPNEIDANNETCQSDAVSGTFNENLFVPFASVLTIGTYIGKAVAFMGMAILAPIVITSVLATKGHFTNIIILALMMILVNLWQLSIFYKLAAFILNKRGMK